MFITPADGSLFMRPFAFAATAYLLMINLLHVITHGQFQLPDRWAEIYTVILGIYAGTPEVKKLVQRSNEPLDGEWDERLRKGGPIITAWLSLLMAAALLRHWDQTFPMPPELRSICMQVMAVFFGSYALRQYRKAAVSRQEGGGGASAEEARQVSDFLAKAGPSTPKAISDGTQIPRRTLTRVISEMALDGRLVREGNSPKNPTATYRLK